MNKPQRGKVLVLSRKGRSLTLRCGHTVTLLPREGHYDKTPRSWSCWRCMAEELGIEMPVEVLTT